MTKKAMAWLYDEFQQVGKDYGKQSEVEVYDSSHSQFRDLEKESLERIEEIGLDSDDVLVDFGCGTGVFARLAAERCAHVVAVDVSQAMLARAREQATAAQLEKMTFCHAGFLTYEHVGPAATVLTSSLSFHHLPDFWKGIALRRLYALLSPGGKFFLADVILSEENPVEKIDRFIASQAELGGDFLKEDAEGHFREEFSTYDWVIDGLLERAGFSIDRKTEMEGIIATYLCSR